jgi:enoyl-CoA hydratase/carnithine racemase
VSPEVRTDRQGPVAIVTLAAPERRNAVSPEMAAELLAACASLDADETVGAVVIRGDGPSFCAGGKLDTLAWVGEDPAEATRYDAMTRIYGSFAAIGRLRAPTVAAVRGDAVGAGLNLALAADLRVVADDARLVAGFLRIGVHPGGGGLTLLNRLAGREAAAALALFGEVVDGRRAREIGLAWESVPEHRVDERALELASVAAADPELARLTVRSLRASGETPLPLEVAAEYERASQIWSLRRRAARTIGQPVDS